MPSRKIVVYLREGMEPRPYKFYPTSVFAHGRSRTPAPTTSISKNNYNKNSRASNACTAVLRYTY